MRTIVIVVFFMFFVIPPCIVILRERNISMSTKISGVLASTFFSWLGLAGYYLIRILKERAAHA